MKRFGLNLFPAAMAAALLGTGSVGLAQESEPEAPSPDPASPNIVVSGEREYEKEEVAKALGEIAMRGRTGFRGLPRFTEPVCPLVTGLGEEHGVRIKARIEANTLAIGHEVGEDGCRPNAFFILVDDPEALIEKMSTGRRGLIEAKSRRRIKATLKAGYPAISWSNRAINDRYGNEAQNAGALAGLDESNSRTNGDLLFNKDHRVIARSDVATGIERTNAVVVFDARKLDNVHLDQLADYATMRILGDVQPFVELGPDQPDTILNLFREDAEDAPPGLTLLDLAYLQGLYAMTPLDPGVRLESFVLAAYEELRKSD